MKYIFEVYIKPGYSAEQYAAAWVRASEIIQQSTGAKGTRLHRKIGNSNMLLAIASWESRDDRLLMSESRNQKVKEIIIEQSEFCDIRLLGEYDEPEWVVEPQFKREKK